MKSVLTQFKLAALVITMLFATAPVGAVAQKPVTNFVKHVGEYVMTKEGVIITILSAMYTRLITKGSSWDYKCSDWRDDLAALSHCWNITDAQTYKTLAYLYDKWVIGRQFSLVDVIFEQIDKDGTKLKVKDKKIKSKAFGMLGLFDGYVIYQIKTFVELGERLLKIQSGMTFDPDAPSKVKPAA